MLRDVVQTPRCRASGLLLVALAAALLLAGAVAAASPSGADGSLGGQVIGLNGRPVAGASVMMQSSDGTHPHATRTDAGGYFRFPKVRYGYYELRAQAKGQWSDWEHIVMVRASHETRVTLRLLLKKPPPNPHKTPAKRAAAPKA